MCLIALYSFKGIKSFIMVDIISSVIERRRLQVEEKHRVPRDSALDSTINIMKEGYLFVKNRADKYNSKLFEARIFGQKAICMSGEEGCRLFYNDDYFIRKGAAPLRIQKTLFGRGAIQTMDGEAHIARKELFLSLMTEDQAKELGERTMEELKASIAYWQNRRFLVLFNELKEILCKVACSWAGIPLQKEAIKARAEDFALMIYSFGSIGPQYWKGKMARCRAEKWIEGLIKEVREGTLKPPESSALYKMADYKEVDGESLDCKMAAIELINVVRPIVAISTFITFAALAIHEYPLCRERLRRREKGYLEAFAQEVRRYYPFAPFLGARVKKDFQWQGASFEEGMLVLLDVYGTNHDADLWDNPYEFIPERFLHKNENPYDFIPQGGGEPSKGHRCPGEIITIEIVKAAVDFLVNVIDYKVPQQNLSYSLRKIPTLPESGFLITYIGKRNYIKYI